MEREEDEAGLAPPVSPLDSSPGSPLDTSPETPHEKAPASSSGPAPLNPSMGVMELIDAVQFSWELYHACRDSGEDFRRLATEVGSLHVVLKEAEDFVRQSPDMMDGERRRRLAVLTNGCRDTLEDLDQLLANYESLGTHAQRTWDRMRWGLADVSDVRNRLISNGALLGAFATSLAKSSPVRVDKRLNKFVTEIRAGLREGSVVTTTDVAETIDMPDVWEQLRRELEDMGISNVVIDENCEHIKAWFREALRDGLLDEDLTTVSSRGAGSYGASTVRTASAVVPPPPSDSGYGGSTRMNSVVSVASMVSANEEFEEDLRRNNAGAGPGGASIEESLAGLSVSQSATPVVVPKKSKTSPSWLLSKLRLRSNKKKNKDDAIIEAASDGNIDEVARLISLGVDVNARDRWGWSALSMCGYGGHTAIARLLLDHGADLDNVDVDGERPEDLARNRGNREMVLLFEEEREERDRKAREMDDEVPRAPDV